jgi:hypothetical protein
MLLSPTMVSTKDTQREKKTAKIMALSTTTWDHTLSSKIHKQSYQALTQFLPTQRGMAQRGNAQPVAAPGHREVMMKRLQGSKPLLIRSMYMWSSRKAISSGTQISNREQC